MDMTTIAAFVAFFALVLAWLAAPTDARRPVIRTEMIAAEPSPIGAD